MKNQAEGYDFTRHHRIQSEHICLALRSRRRHQLSKFLCSLKGFGFTGELRVSHTEKRYHAYYIADGQRYVATVLPCKVHCDIDVWCPSVLTSETLGTCDYVFVKSYFTDAIMTSNTGALLPNNNHSSQRTTHRNAIHQLLELYEAPTSTNDSPTSETMMATVNGPMTRTKIPAIPVNPITASKMAAEISAPWISLMRLFHGCSVVCSPFVVWLVPFTDWVTSDV